MICLWVAYSMDKYQLPVAVADSAAELAAMCHTTTHRVLDSSRKAQQRNSKRAEFRRVFVEDFDMGATE